MSIRSMSSPHVTGIRLVLAAVVGLGFTIVAATPSFAATGTIQIIQGGTGSGTVTSSPAGIDCTIGSEGPTGACVASFEEGTKVRLKAVAADGSDFLGFAPVRTCMRATVTVEADTTHECQPVFEREPGSEFLLQAVPEGSGTVATSNEDGSITTSCTHDADAGETTGVCAAVYPTGAVVTMTATAAAGWTFTVWRTETEKDKVKGGDCADGVVTINQRERCVAVFVRN